MRIQGQPVVLPVPFGDDVFDAGLYRRAGVQRLIIYCPVRLHIIPDQHGSGLRSDADFDLRKFGRAALGDVDQEDHCGPAALPAGGAFRPLIIMAGVVEIVMRLDFLADVIALALYRLA